MVEVEVDVSEHARAGLATQLLNRDQLPVTAESTCDQQCDLPSDRADVRRTGASLDGGRTEFLAVEVSADAAHRSVLEPVSASGDARTVLTVAALAAAGLLAEALLALRAVIGIVLRTYSSWSKCNPISSAAEHLLAGRGGVAVVAREILCRVEPEHRRPTVADG